MHKIYLVSPATEVIFKSPCNSLEYIKYYIMDSDYKQQYNTEVFSEKYFG